MHFIEQQKFQIVHSYHIISKNLQSFVIDPNVKIGQVHLRVSDIQESVDFYKSILGLHRVGKTSSDKALLSADGSMPYLLYLHKSKNKFDPIQKRRLGLYHFAMLVPHRKNLADFFMHLQENLDAVKIDGYADHAVSEAIYIRDPDYNGIEIYSDRPNTESIWNKDQISMTAEPLDIRGLLAESTKSWTGFPAKTVIGHVHLHVSNLVNAKKFYSEILGMTNTASMQGALFFAAGKYHHHIATNVWLGENIPKASTESPGLDYFTLQFSSKDKLREMADNLESHKISMTKLKDGTPFFISDDDEISIRLDHLI